MTRALRVLAVAMPLAVGACWFHLFSPTTAWAPPIAFAISAILAGAALGTAIAGVRLRIAIATVLLAGEALALWTSLAGFRLIPYDMVPDRRLAIVVCAALVLTVVGLVRKRVWARWLGLALGAVGALSGGLNAVKFWPATRAIDIDHLDWSMDVFLGTWVLLVTALGGAMIVINLAAPAVRDAFAAKHRDATWTSDHAMIRWLRATLVASFAAVPMLLVYAWLQPVVPATQDTALVLAAVLTLGGVLAVRGKVIGAVLLVLAGAGLLAQTAVTALAIAPAQREIAGYYAIFWLPAALLALATGVRLAGPAWRLLRHVD